ncbi:MAG: DUF4965 domain-containing protein [Treponema sp.]|jgi:hypothetical protein|nr:DUF4965 domain-containing protein [Treponema sp.]
MRSRVPSVPLITCDPYFSVWSPADRLYDADTVHWTGRRQRITGNILVDGKEYRFMGDGTNINMDQIALEITATSSRYSFECDGISLDIVFLTPLLMDDLDLLSRPVSYICARVVFKDNKSHDVDIRFSFDSAFCRVSEIPVPLVSGIHSLKNCGAAWMGQRRQAPLSQSGDGITIDWGYLYLAVPEKFGQAFRGEESLSISLKFPGLKESGEAFFVAAYDDIASINYFGEMRRGYWARNGKTIIQLIEEAIEEFPIIRERCATFDRELNEKAEASVGPDYQDILNLAYRQTIAGHKLITDEKGEVVFISKECFSNGCASTADVSYPSCPLYLLYNPELVWGMLRPILRFARYPAWTFDFAPHDAGRYPHVTGQVYGLTNSGMSPIIMAHGMRFREGETYPPYYSFPSNENIYEVKNQMPVEECGNMLILMAAAAKAGANTDFRPFMDLAEKWAMYLEKYGINPGEQLCTDDFAGHLARNCNLAVKAIMGLESYAILLEINGDSENSLIYHNKAKVLAGDWENNASRADHSALTFDNPEGWSLKYNLIWDKVFNSKLFSSTFFESETRWYIRMGNKYGIPMDSRRDYTKSDWLLWITAFSSDKAERESFVKPVVKFLRETPDRVPFSDWYDTVNAKHYHMRNRTVQGGLFMPLLVDMWAKKYRG